MTQNRLDFGAEREKQSKEDAERKWLEKLLDAQQKEDEELLRQRQMYFETDPVTEIEHQLLLELEKEHAEILQYVQDGKRAYTDKDYQKYWVPLRRLICAYPPYGREAATGAEEICAAVLPALHTASNPYGK